MPKRQKAESDSLAWVISLSFFVVLCIACSVGYNIYNQIRHEELSRDTERYSHLVSNHLASWYNLRLDMVNHVGDQWVDDFEGNPEKYEEHVLFLLESFKGLQALNYVDTDGVIQQVVPQKENLKALGKNLNTNPREGVRVAIQKANLTKSQARTPANITLYQGGLGFAVYSPIVDDMVRLQGFLNAVFLMEDAISEAYTKEYYSRYLRLAIHEPASLCEDLAESLDKEILVYCSESKKKANELEDCKFQREWPYAVRSEVQIADQPWIVTLAPSQNFLVERMSDKPKYVLLGSLCFSALVSLLVWLYVRRNQIMRRRDERARLLLDATGDAIFRIDSNGICTFANLAARRIVFPDDSESVVGRRIEDCCQFQSLHHEPLSPDQVGLTAAYQSGEKIEAEQFRLLRPDNSGVVVQLVSHPYLAKGHVKGAIVSFVDISERVAAEQTKRRLISMLEASPECVGIFNLSGKFIYLNVYGRKLFSLRRNDDPKQVSLMKHLPYQDRKNILKNVIPATNDNGICNGECELISLSGEKIPFAFVLQKHMSSSGRPEFYSVSARDIRLEKTAAEDLRSYEAQLQHVQKLESLGVLAGGMAHDFNNILTGILGSVGLLAANDQIQKEDQKLLNVIEKSAHRASDLCKGMLAYAGNSQVNRELLDLRKLAEEIVSMLSMSLPKKHEISLESEYKLAAVDGDASQLSQILLNLVTNASDALGDHDGRIQISLRKIDCTSQDLENSLSTESLEAGPFVEVEVIDSGCGMDSDTIAKMFDPFYSSKFTGRGLGMAAVLGIVRGHSGAIFVDSELNKGTAIRVLLPASDKLAFEISQPEIRTAHLDSQEKCILVVDDEASIRELVTEALEAEGYRVLSAVDGQDGLEKLNERGSEIDCILLDMTMPKMNGNDCLPLIRDQFKDIPVILSSGFTEFGDLSSLTQDDATSFLQKPYTIDQLVSSVQSACQGSSIKLQG